MCLELSCVFGCHYDVICFYPFYSNSTDGSEPRPLRNPIRRTEPSLEGKLDAINDIKGDPSRHRFFSA